MFNPRTLDVSIIRPGQYHRQGRTLWSLGCYYYSQGVLVDTGWQGQALLSIQNRRMAASIAVNTCQPEKLAKGKVEDAYLIST